MPSTRENILVRLLAILDEMEGERYVARNVTNVGDDEDQLPALVLIDGDEEAIDDNPTRRPSTVPRRFEMTPLIHIAMVSKPEELGTDLNVLRDELIKAVTTDTTLLDLVDRFGIRYDGMESARNEQGRMVISQRFMRFTFTYLLVPHQL